MTWTACLWEKRTLITRSRAWPLLEPLVLQSLSWGMRHDPWQLRSSRIRNATYLNAGCGQKPRPGFVNLDYTWRPGVDLVWDLGWRLPFADRSLRGIYTEHCLEHLPLAVATEHVLPEFHRVLSAGGRVRLIVPDGGLYLQLYAESRHREGVFFPILTRNWSPR